MKNIFKIKTRRYFQNLKPVQNYLEFFKSLYIIKEKLQLNMFSKKFHFIFLIHMTVALKEFI
jgi:hypothetical protein